VPGKERGETFPGLREIRRSGERDDVVSDAIPSGGARRRPRVLPAARKTSRVEIGGGPAVRSRRPFVVSSSSEVVVECRTPRFDPSFFVCVFIGRESPRPLFEQRQRPDLGRPIVRTCREQWQGRRCRKSMEGCDYEICRLQKTCLEPNR